MTPSRSSPPLAMTRWAGPLMALCLVSPALSWDQPADDTTRLEDILITPQRNPLDESIERLRTLLSDSTPCLGCDAAPLSVRRTLAERLVRYVFFPIEPPLLDRQARRDARIAIEHRAEERGPEMDFLKF